jgi:hypothetical protein
VLLLQILPYQQYFKEGRALRTETVICNTQDFGIGRRVCAKNWNALRAVGESANRRLCDAESAEALPAPDVVTFHQVTRPSNSEDGLYAPALALRRPESDGSLGEPGWLLPSRRGFLATASWSTYRCLTRRTQRDKPLTICAGSNARGSSSKRLTAIATSSPRWVAEWRYSLPRPTGESWLQV